MLSHSVTQTFPEIVSQQDRDRQPDRQTDRMRLYGSRLHTQRVVQSVSRKPKHIVINHTKPSWVPSAQAEGGAVSLTQTYARVH